MGAEDADAVAITEDGTLAAVSRHSSPGTTWRRCSARTRRRCCARSAAPMALTELRALNQRARAFALEQLTSAASVEWLARFTHLVDAAILARVAGLAGIDERSASWCFCGLVRRGESLTSLMPALLTVFEDGVPDDAARSQHRVLMKHSSSAATCLDSICHSTRTSTPRARVNGRAVSAAGFDDPVGQQTYRVRSLFDVRAGVRPRAPLAGGQDGHRRAVRPRVRARAGQ